MISVDFTESSGVVRGDHLTDHYGQPVGNVYAYCDKYETITKWKASWTERLVFAWSGTIWLRIMGRMPPVSISLDNPWENPDE